MLKPVVYEPESDRVSSGELMLFIGASFVVTVRHGEGAPLAEVRRRLEADPEVLKHGPTAVLYAVSDAIVDHYLDVAGELEVDWRSWRRTSSRPPGATRRTPRSGSTRRSGRSWSSGGPAVRSPGRWPGSRPVRCRS